VSILLRLAYDGTGFHGWARQHPRADGTVVRTVQGELERALGVLCKQEVATRGASRTDAGVHAEGQLVAIERVTPIPCANLVGALNRMLPVDVAVRDAWEQTADDGGPVEPRHANDGKHYRYRLFLGEVREPSVARYVWQLEQPIDLGRVREAAAHFLGTHDFAAFRTSMCQASTTVRTIHAVDVETTTSPAGAAMVEIHVRGTAFLHNMVRIMVGTLVEIGHGRFAPGHIAALLDGGTRGQAGRTAPPGGLTLVEVLWRRPS
jgi:tRNA pseudouridine38-40 synthase